MQNAVCFMSEIFLEGGNVFIVGKIATEDVP